MMMSRSAASKSSATSKVLSSSRSHHHSHHHSSSHKHKKSKNVLPTLEDLIHDRDYTGALALLEFKRRDDELTHEEVEALLIDIGYVAFHLGKYDVSLEVYNEIISNAKSSDNEEKKEAPKEVRLYIACVYYYMQMYPEAMASANLYTASVSSSSSSSTTNDNNTATFNSLKNRILFHVSHKLNDEAKLMTHHQLLTDTNADQLSLAAIHYLRGHFQEATDIYKRLLLENRDDLALNVYVAMCYYKLDYYDVSLEILAVYLQSFPDSAVAINLKACNHFRLYNGKAAETELKALSSAGGGGSSISGNDLIRHNMVVFSSGSGALQVLPSLVDFIPEARLNLVIYYLRHDGVLEAEGLLRELEATTPQDHILKGVVHASLGQSMGSKESLKDAQKFFQLVGSSASECDTIPGRQSMASCFFLLHQFEDVNIYLNSIKQYMYNDDDFNWNYGISLAASASNATSASNANTGNFKKAEEALLLVASDAYKQEYCYTSWLARCYIMNGSPRNAWELYLKMDTSNESFNLLQLIANDCYRMGNQAFLYAAKAFDVLERLDPDPEYWEGKRGACVGVFQRVVAGEGDKEELREVLAMVRNTSNPQVEYMIRVIRKWAKENNVKI